jgi:hypothetical protein
MRTKLLVPAIFFLVSFGGSYLAAQNPLAAERQEPARPSASIPPDASTVRKDAAPEQGMPSRLEEVIDRMIAREQEQIKAFDRYSPIIETYIQEVKADLQLGTVPKSDYYFLGQADPNGRLKVHSAVKRGKKGSLMWTYDPAGFLQMIFVDRGEFDKDHYHFKYAKREFLGELRCFVFDVSPAEKARGARFVGRIWVEDQDFTIVRINGKYSPAVRFSLKTFQDEYYLHFDSWRTNAKPGLWLPNYIYSQELGRPMSFSGPRYKSQTRLWGYNLSSSAREEELNQLLVESQSAIKDEAAQHDRSPLEAQREWRHESENNVLDALERDGFLAPPGEIDKVLNTIVNNLEVTNNLSGQIDLHCRVLLTTTLEMFSIHNTIVLSRGLIDVVPDEATLAAMVAQGIADAMVPKSYQDQYGFSDVLRLSSREILKRLTFLNEKKDTEENSVKAMELLKKSPYAGGLGNAGLFLAQLHSQAKELKQLISPRLGNQVFLASQLLQSAPALQRDNKEQIAALPLGARVKLDPYSDRVTLMKTKAAAPNSAREKMPFEVTPLVPYLMRYAESAEAVVNSNAAVALNQQN